MSKIKVPTRCPIPECESETDFFLDRTKYYRWRRGDFHPNLIQDIFSEMSASEREQLASGYCDDCQVKLLSEYDNDDDLPF